MPINPDFSNLESVITAKVESVATNIDNKDLLIQMKALEAAVANLALTKVIAEGTYQQGLVTSTANTAITELNAGIVAAETSLDQVVAGATTDLSDAKDAAILEFNTTSAQVLDDINTLLEELGSVNTQDIIDLVTQSLADIAAAANTASDAINSLKDDAVTVLSSTGTAAIETISAAKDESLSSLTSQESSSISAIVSARDAAINAVSASGDVSRQIEFIRNDRWLGLNIFAPNNYSGN